MHRPDGGKHLQPVSLFSLLKLFFLAALQNALLTVLCTLFFLPLVLALAFVLFDSTVPQSVLFQQWFNHPWLRNRSLAGAQNATSVRLVDFSHRSLADGTWQKSFAEFYDKNFPGREALIRWLNEGYGWAFHRPASYSSGTIFGKGQTLFEKYYFIEQFLRRPAQEKVDQWVSKLGELQRLCRERGLPFVFVITPSKVSLCPEWVPDRWKMRARPGATPYEQLVPLLKKHGITFVDGVALAREGAAMGSFKSSPFPPGGIHWTHEAALPAVNEILRKLGEQGLEVSPLAVESLTIVQSPTDIDTDIANLMNFAWPWKYPTSEIKIAPRKEGARYTLAAVGGSFGYHIASLLGWSNQFSEIDWFFYLKLHKQSWFDGNLHRVREPAGEIDYGREIFGADALLLELNEGAMGEAKHVTTFLKRALDYLEAHPEDKRTFLYESYLDCKPGIPVPVSSSFPTAAKRNAFTGFGMFTPAMAWTDANVGRLRLHWNGEKVPGSLQLTLGVDVNEGDCREAVVGVFVNDVWLADWKFNAAMNISPRSVQIPMAALKFGPEMTIDLKSRQVEPPLSSAVIPSGPKIFVSEVTLFSQSNGKR